jgi:CheY-like chemotaxis protein
MAPYDVIFIDDEVSLTEIFQHYVLAKYRDWRFITFSNASMVYSEILDERLSAAVWIVDLMMPGKNGAQVAAAIRQRFGQTPVILAYTALDRQQIQQEPQYRSGAVHFNQIINKMEDPISLLSLVDVWVQRSRVENATHTG